MTTAVKTPSFSKNRALSIIGALLLLTSTDSISYEYTNSQPIDDLFTVNAGEIATLKPGVQLKLAPGVGGFQFMPGSTLMYEVDGNNCGLIDATDHMTLVVFYPNSSIIMKNTGAPVIEGPYELIKGDISSTQNLEVVLQNSSGTLITTSYLLHDATSGYLRATIIAQSAPTQTVIDQTVITSDDTFNGNITDNIPQDSCPSHDQKTGSFNYSTPTHIAMNLHRFMGSDHAMMPSKYAPLLALPGIRDRQTDLLKVINEGQMPTSQFTLLNKGIRVWMTGIYNYYQNKLSQMNYKAPSKGFQIGIDSTSTPLPIGLSFAYMATRPEVARVSIGRNRTSQVGLYGGYGLNNFMVFGTASYIHGHNKLGNFTKKHFTTNSFSAYVRGSYSHRLPGKNILEPLVALSYGHTWVPTIHDYLGSILTRTIKAKESNSVRSELGLRWSHFLGVDNKAQTPVKLYIQALWKHNYRNKQKTGTMQFIDSNVITTSFGQRQAKNTADIGMGIIVRKNDIDLSLSCGTTFAQKVRNHTGMAGIRIQI